MGRPPFNFRPRDFDVYEEQEWHAWPSPSVRAGVRAGLPGVERRSNTRFVLCLSDNCRAERQNHVW